LVCGRLGRLFEPALAPISRIVQLPADLTKEVTYPNSSTHPSSGPSFGSLVVEGVVETKAGGTDALSAETVAAVVVFQSWLAAQDPAGLVQADTGHLLSIDHAWYLTGPQWQDGQLDAERPAVTACVNLLGSVERFRDPSVFTPALVQLAGLPERSVVQAFSGIPETWSADLQFRARLARYTLLRRDYVEEALSAVWKGS
jgi:hypothetical protein